MILTRQPTKILEPQFTDTASEYPWFEIAEKEIGVAEIPGTKNNRRIIEYHASTSLKAAADEIPWCSSFVNWCLEKAGYKGTKSAAAKSWLKWKSGQKIEEPRRGCIIIFNRGTVCWQGHVGFYVANHGQDSVYVLGGNQNKKVSVSSYRKQEIIGYRWPVDNIPESKSPRFF